MLPVPFVKYNNFLKVQEKKTMKIQTLAHVLGFWTGAGLRSKGPHISRIWNKWI